MRRPADCLEDARALLAERRAQPAALARADQLAALGAEHVRRLRHGYMRLDGERGVAFQWAAMEAMGERMAEPSGVMCVHMVDLEVLHIVDLRLGLVACPDCAADLAADLDYWDRGRCDVCGQCSAEDPPGRGAAAITFALGPAVAFGDICRECAVWVAVFPVGNRA